MPPVDVMPQRIGDSGGVISGSATAARLPFVSMAAIFDVDDLVSACQEAAASDDPLLATRDVLGRAVERPSSVADVLRPELGGLNVLHNTPELTVLNVVWAPGMTLLPHDHRMWAAIAVYVGREDNAFFRRVPDDRGHLAETGGKVLDEGHVLLLGDDAIHSVHNPLERLTAAIHVYGGDFVREPRSQWGPGELEEHPYDLDFVMREFAEANARAGLGGEK
jgi:predicted metal-dependent enzyme (double-stranded beta helix superfamily)